MELYEINREPKGAIAPALIVSFEDWVDAGSAGSMAARHIAEGGEIVATFDTDALYDYRSHRPVLDIVDGIPKRLEFPQLTLKHRNFPERDLFVLAGPEPDARWKEFAADVNELALRLGVIEHVSLGAIPSAIPHTAPTPVMMTASSDELKRDAIAAEGLLRVPAAAVSLIEWTNAESGIPAVGFWAQVPHYAMPYAGGAIALVRRVESHLSMTIGAGGLEDQDRAEREALDRVFEANPDASSYLERLQSMVDEQAIPAAENIGEEVERFLRNQRRGEQGPNPFSP
ncbi:MAG: PAC2 family protein [Actinobacteria bacterium]|nr:PAC2 family protein [Actinomycetota bacterium]